ncbi:MAG: hypothetical protein ACOCUI_02715 [bacterium]
MTGAYTFNRIKKISIVLFISIVICILIFGCYAYRPNLKGLTPEEVIFEFNRILNRINEPEFFKGILSITTGEAYKEAERLLHYVLLKDSQSLNQIKEEINAYINYFKRIKIIILDFKSGSNTEKGEETIIYKVAYYDDLTKISDLKFITLVKKGDVWKISSIKDIQEEESNNND